MDKKNINNEPVTEEDYDLFYGFVDSVFEEKKRFETPEEKDTLAVTEPDWTPEPFEEFIVGMPQQESGKYYALNIVSPDSTTSLTSDIHPNHYGTISGIITSVALSSALLFALYFFTTEPDPAPAIVSNKQLDKLEQSVTAVENSMQSVTAMQSQMKAIVTQLTALNRTISTQQKKQQFMTVTTKAQIVDPLELQLGKLMRQPIQLNSAIDSPLAHNKIVPDGAWLINVASFKSKARAQTLLEEIQAIDLPVETFAIRIKGKDWIRVRIPSFKRKLEASEFMLKLNKIMPGNDPWVGLR